MSVQRSKRDLALTIRELMESKRLDIAIRNWENDPMLLKAILTELGLEVMRAVKDRIIRVVGKSYGKGWVDEVTGLVRGKGLQQYELLPVLRELDVDDFNNFNIYWGLSPLEAELYLADIKGNLTPEERKAVFEKVKARFIKESK